MSVNNQDNGIDSMLKDVKTTVRGKDPDNYREKCLELCQTFLSSYWLTLTVKDIEVERLTGGMTNHIYRCKALTTNGVEDKETPNEAVIRFYGNKYDSKTCPKGSRFYDGMVAWIASSEGLGPEVYGLFEGGQVLKYYKHRLMEDADIYDQDKLETVAQMLAKYHNMSPPMEKDIRKNWFIEYTSELFVDDFYGKFMAENKSLLEKTDCKALLNLDLKAEILWLKKRIDSFESPIVFCHHDFRVGNTLVTDNNGIVLSDFDISVFGYRGYDFASFFLMNFESRVDNRFEFKDESIVRQFITSYVKQCERMYGKHYSDNPLNSVQHILEECKRCLLCPTIMIIAFFILYGQEFPFSKEHQLNIINEFVEKWNAIKAMLIKDNLVQK